MWEAKNFDRFKGKSLNILHKIIKIKGQIALTKTNSTTNTSSFMDDFQIIKAFKLVGRQLHAPYMKVVLWHLPLMGWLK